MGSKRRGPHGHMRREAGPFGQATAGDPRAERLRIKIAEAGQDIAKRRAAGTWRPDASDGPKHTYFAPCTRAQANEYGCIEYALKMGLLPRHVYPMSVHAPKGGGAYFLLVMSHEEDAFRAELPLLFPGVEDWMDYDEERAARGIDHDDDDDRPGPDVGPLYVTI